MLGTLVTDVGDRADPALDLDCGDCRLCIDACPTAPSTSPASSTRRDASPTGRSRRRRARRVRAEIGDRVYGCDICQDVCPWNRGVEKRRAGAADLPGAEPAVSLADWLGTPPAELRARYERLFVPRNDARFLQRNALLASEQAGDVSLLPFLERLADGDDEVLAGPASGARERLSRRPSAGLG